MTDASKAEKYKDIFSVLDTYEGQSRERIYCSSGQTFARELDPKTSLKIKDPADYCTAIIERSIDYNSEGFTDRSLLGPYAYILYDKKYKVSEQGASSLQDRFVQEIKGDAANVTTIYNFTPKGVKNVDPFSITPGLALDVGAVEAAQTQGKNIDISEYKGTDGKEKLMRLAEQCYLNNEKNPLKGAKAKLSQPVTISKCFEVGEAIAIQHMRPETASLQCTTSEKAAGKCKALGRD